MKHSYNVYAWKSILFVLILVTLNNGVMAQVPSDTTKSKVDTTTMMPADTAKPAQAAAHNPSRLGKKSKTKAIQFLYWRKL